MWREQIVSDVGITFGRGFEREGKDDLMVVTNSKPYRSPREEEFCVKI